MHCAFDLHRYDLHSYAVMANHIHVLLTPFARIRWIMRELKGSTARQSNSILDRNEGQFLRIKNYIERNPVKAGLVANPEGWPWSSATK